MESILPTLSHQAWFVGKDVILTYRYISGLTWQQIAFNIGEHDEQYPRRKHNKFLDDSGRVSE